MHLNRRLEPWAQVYWLNRIAYRVVRLDWLEVKVVPKRDWCATWAKVGWFPTKFDVVAHVVILLNDRVSGLILLEWVFSIQKAGLQVCGPLFA